MIYSLYLSYDYIEPVLDDGSGPWETSAVTGLVEAGNEEAAKEIFLSYLKGSKWVDLVDGNGYEKVEIYEALSEDFDYTNVKFPIIGETIS